MLSAIYNRLRARRLYGGLQASYTQRVMLVTVACDVLDATYGGLQAFDTRRPDAAPERLEFVNARHERY